MAAGKEARGRIWVDGQFAARVRGPGPGPGRVIRVRRPFALIGRAPGVDIRIDDPAVDDRHAFLLLDRRGIFGVDLLSRGGTRFAGAACGSSWLGVGDVVEVAGRRVELLQLRVDGTPIDPPLADVDLLADAGGAGLVDLTLGPLDSTGPPWMLGSALAFVGRGEACAIRVEDDSASGTHCALLRGHSTAYAIDLLGRRSLVNDRTIEGASALLDGDVLTIGRTQFAVRIDRPSESMTLARAGPAEVDRRPEPGGLPLSLRESMLALLLRAAESGRDSSDLEILEVLRRFQADTATLLEAQVGRIEALQREIASLRDEIRGVRGPLGLPAERLRLDLKSPPAVPPGNSATWLIDRLNTLEAESRSTWKDLLGRITSNLGFKPAPSTPGQTLATNRPGPPAGDPS